MSFPRRNIRAIVLVCALHALLIGGLLVVNSPNATAAACAAPTTDYGTVTGLSITITQATSYRIWSRIAVPNTTDNSYLLEITGPSGTSCITVGGNANIPVSTSMTAPLNWQWIDYQDGTTTSKSDLTLDTGTYTIKMIGNKPNVAVDRVILTANKSCVPSSTGENCANPPDTISPDISLSSPAAGATVTGTVTISATATDDSGVLGRVDFYVDDALVGTDSTLPYAIAYDTKDLTPGAHNIKAKAVDGANNLTTTGNRVINIQDVSAPSNVVITINPAAGALKGTAAVAITAADNVAVTKVQLFVNAETVPIAEDNVAPFSVSFRTTDRVNGNYTLKAVAYDAAGNSTAASLAVTVNNPLTPPTDIIAPQATITSPTANSQISGTQYNFATTATDAVGVTKVEFYRDDVLVSSLNDPPYSVKIDTTALTNGSHSFHVIAYDAAGNKSIVSKVNAIIANQTFLKEDVNQSGKVDTADLIAIAVKFGQTGANLGRADVKTDLIINMQDMIAVATKFGMTSSL